MAGGFRGLRIQGCGAIRKIVGAYVYVMSSSEASSIPILDRRGYKSSGFDPLYSMQALAQDACSLLHTSHIEYRGTGRFTCAKVNSFNKAAHVTILVALASKTTL